MTRSSPLNGKLVTLFGGSGFLGQYLAQALLERGARLRIASRNPEKSHKLKPLANLGQIQFVRCNINDARQVHGAVSGANAVVNLVGSFGGDLMQLMGNSAGVVASATKAAGAEALVHISAIGADAESASTYARANALGEELVREHFADATILRPSALFGEDDNFVNMFAGLIQMMPVLPVFGPNSELQPAFVDDLAEAIVNALENPSAHGGKTYELGGPEVITMMELNKRIADAQGRKRTFLPVPDAASAAFAAMPLTPINRDQWVMLKEGNCASGKYPGFKKLGVTPRPLGLFLDKWMVRYRKHGRFNERLAS
uniref:complex I NDUFA9 subunit family protein n=1 Tax=uncultured Altererythrobacter sp. TaxID=500840 RepID=UPI00260435F0|nr:complex I NDUFA9 subunit family protein [uncultured Altererythrobacter sp.]